MSHGIIPLILLLLTPPVNRDHERFSSDIAKREILYNGRTDLLGGVVFTGSSSIVNWKTLSKDFAGLPVVNMGFGGSTMADAVTFVERTTIAFKPRTVVLYAGDNDLKQGVSVKSVVGSFKIFVNTIRKANPNTKFIFISIKPSLARENLLPLIRDVNNQIADYAKNVTGIQFADVFTPMLDNVGRPRPELFVADGLHMTPKGYAIWTDIIYPVARESMLSKTP